MRASRLPPIWLMGLATLSQAIVSAICLMTVPQLLSALHVPETRIAQVTTLALIPAFGVFIFAPILDVRFSRRTYAVFFAVLSGAFVSLALINLTNLTLLSALLFASQLSGGLCVAAIGGWFSGIVPKEREAALSAWFIVAQVGGFGLTSIIAIVLLRGLPYAVGALALGLMIILPTAILILPPAPGPDRRLARESFSQFVGDLLALLRQKTMLQTLLLFSVPAACFALTNAFGGLGRDYGASERFVGLVGGAGVTAAGIFGSLIVPVIARYIRPRPLFLLVGSLGSCFTVALTMLPHTPAIFALAMVSENIFWAASFTAMEIIAFGAIGKNNPFASTQYALIVSVASLPLVYMQLLDGQAYGLGGLNAMFATDGGLGLLACLLLAILLVVWSRMRRGEPVPPPP